MLLIARHRMPSIYRILLALVLTSTTVLSHSKSHSNSVSGKIEFCPSIVEYEDKGKTVEFVIRGPAPDEDHYIAFGLSSDKKMGDDSVVACIRYNNKISAALLYNDGYSNKLVQNVANDFQLMEKSYEDGVLMCKVKRNVTSTNKKIFNLNDDWYVLHAAGNSRDDDALKKHKTAPKFTKEKVDFQKTSVQSGHEGPKELRKAHACLMLVAWILCSSLGVVIARHYKPMWPGSKILNSPIWFQAHRFFLLLAFTCTAIAFIIIFVAVDGYSQVGQGDGKRLHMAHPILGIIVMSFATINPIMALFRPKPDGKFRPLFNYAHFGVGTVARLAAVVTIFIGFDMTPWVDRSSIYIMAVFLVYEVLMEIALEVLTFVIKKMPPCTMSILPI